MRASLSQPLRLNLKRELESTSESKQQTARCRCAPLRETELSRNVSWLCLWS